MCRFNFLDFNEYADDNDDNDPQQSLQCEDPPSNLIPFPSDPPSHDSSPIHSQSGSSKYLNVPGPAAVQQIFGKGKGHYSPLLQSHRTNSESYLASPQIQELHVTRAGINRSLSSSCSGNLALGMTNGLSEKDRGHTRSRSSGSSSGDSDSGHTSSKVKRAAAGPLSSSSLPPDGLKRLVMQGKSSTLKQGQITVSYQAAT